jgi:hypothetical protein
VLRGKKKKRLWERLEDEEQSLFNKLKELKYGILNLGLEERKKNDEILTKGNFTKIYVYKYYFFYHFLLVNIIYLLLHCCYLIFYYYHHYYLLLLFVIIYNYYFYCY